MQKTRIALFLTLIQFFGYAQSHYLTAQTVNSASPHEHRWLEDNPRGFYNVTTFSADFFYSPVINGMQTICGYRLNPFIAIGGGIGIERYVSMKMYDTLTANLTQMPVFGEVRFTLLKGKISPVIALQGGYKFLINESSSQVASWDVAGYPPSYTHYDEYDYYHEGGFCFTVEAGVRMKVYRRFAVNLSACYTVSSVSGDHYKWMYVHLVAPGGGDIVNTYLTRVPTLAYQHILLFRLGFSF
jgi:hypothetical protein